VAALQERGSGWLGRERDVSSQLSISLYSYSTLMSLTLYSYVSHTTVYLTLLVSHTHTHFLSLTCTEAFEVYVLCYVIHCRMQPPDIVRHML